MCSRSATAAISGGRARRRHSLSGGALPLADAVLIGLGRFNRILDIDYAIRCLTAQSGVTNLA
ncbi:MAG: hypothetical protein IPK48_00135 [Gammaproteobacteria bacterium]|nr:hypothetical protein [Gammaproteobacteria bacterium]